MLPLSCVGEPPGSPARAKSLTRSRSPSFARSEPPAALAAALAATTPPPPLPAAAPEPASTMHLQSEVVTVVVNSPALSPVDPGATFWPEGSWLKAPSSETSGVGHTRVLGIQDTLEPMFYGPNTPNKARQESSGVWHTVKRLRW